MGFGKAGGVAAGLGLLLWAGCGPSVEGNEVDPDGLELRDEEVAPAPTGQLRFSLQPGRTNYAIASADARVDASQPDTNFGSTTRLRVDDSPKAESYLRFSMVGLGARVNNARLRMYATTPSGTSAYVMPAPGTWDEATLTWNTAPEHELTALETSLPVYDEQWVELDVTRVVQADGTYDFVVGTTSHDGASLVSRESTLEALRPQLVVNTEPSDCTPGEHVESFEVTWPDRTFHVSEASPDTRLSRREILTVDGVPRREAFLSFTLDRRGRTLARAVLRMNARDGSASPPPLHLVQPYSWRMDNRTWNTRPGIAQVVATTSAPINDGSLVEYDVTQLVRESEGAWGSNRTGFRVELALRSTSADGVEFYSPYHPNNAVWPRITAYYDTVCPSP